MSLLLKNGRVVDPANNLDAVQDVLVADGKIEMLGKNLAAPAGAEVVDARGKIVGMLQTPASRIAQVVAAPAAKVARVVGAYAKKSEAAMREEKILEFWRDNKIFEQSLNKEAPKGDYVFYDGPPFATGGKPQAPSGWTFTRYVVPRLGWYWSSTAWM